MFLAGIQVAEDACTAAALNMGTGIRQYDGFFTIRRFYQPIYLRAWQFIHEQNVRQILLIDRSFPPEVDQSRQGCR